MRHEYEQLMLSRGYEPGFSDDSVTFFQSSSGWAIGGLRPDSLGPIGGGRGSMSRASSALPSSNRRMNLLSMTVTEFLRRTGLLRLGT